MKRASTYDLRLEFERINRDMRKQSHVCANCGSMENIELHHVVPLFKGGTNEPGNIKPLCHSCHCLAHAKKIYQKSEKIGRPKKMPPKGYEAVLDKYISGKIGTKEAFKLLGLSAKSLTLTQYWWYRDYLNSKGIDNCSYVNRVDLCASQEKRIQTSEINREIKRIKKRMGA